MLSKKIRRYGIKHSELKNYKVPVLVRVVNVSSDDSVACTKISMALNTNPTNEEDVVNQALAVAKVLPESDIQLIAKEVEKREVEIEGEIFMSVGMRKILIDILRVANVINIKNTEKFIASNSEFTADGEELAKKILIASLLRDRRCVEASLKEAHLKELLVGSLAY